MEALKAGTVVVSGGASVIARVTCSRCAREGCSVNERFVEPGHRLHSYASVGDRPLSAMRKCSYNLLWSGNGCK